MYIDTCIYWYNIGEEHFKKEDLASQDSQLDKQAQAKGEMQVVDQPEARYETV